MKHSVYIDSSQRMAKQQGKPDQSEIEEKGKGKMGKERNLKRRILALMLAFIMVFTMIPAMAWADGSAEPTINLVSVTNDAQNVTMTLSNKGVIESGKDGELIANKPLTVGDADNDGSITFNDALIVLHQEYNAEGASAYKVEDNGYVTKLWNEETSNTLFFKNNKGFSTLVKETAISEGDKLVASINSDSTYYADWYTYFDIDSKKAVVKDEITLELKGFQGMAFDPTVKATAGLKIGTISEGTFSQLGDSVTNQEGKVTLSFDQAGVYYITAKGTVNDDVMDYNQNPPVSVKADCPIIAPVCKIVVSDKAVERIAVTEKNGNECPAEGYAYNVGDTATTLKVSTIENVPGATYTYKWKFKTAPDAASSNAGSSNAIKKQTFTPKTEYDEEKYYYCEVQSKYNGKIDTYETDLVKVKVIANGAQQPRILNELSNAVYMQGTKNVVVLDAKAENSDKGILSYQWYVRDGEGEFQRINDAESEKYIPSTDTVGTKEYYCEITNTLKSVSGKTYRNSITTEIVKITVKSPDEMGADWEGDGTAQNPFLLNNSDDLVKLSELVNNGITFDGKHFELTDDVTLPDDWQQIGSGSATGNGTAIKPFSGHFNGGTHTVSISEGGKSLFLYVREASISNLKIYGPRIEGYGLIDGYTVDYGADGINNATNPKFTVRIDHCVLKAGTKTLKSGFIGGYASGVNTVTIRDCVIENGVEIGYKKDQSNIGGFAGEFNGTIIHCQNSGSVYGINFVGGICADKGQSMGPCNIYDCTFDGTIEASGNYVGGILGAGYGGTGWGFTANSPWPTVVNCRAEGTITGGNYIGGILGAEPGTLQCWNNGVGYIQNNLFTGSVSASSDGTYIGGVIGYIKALNRFTVISNNFYEEGHGASVGIGRIEYIENAESDGKSVGSGWVKATFNNKQYGRDDDPIGKDADKLAKACTPSELSNGTVVKKLNAGLNSSGNWVQTEKGPSLKAGHHLISISSSEISAMNALKQTVNDVDVLKGKQLTLQYSDGTQEYIDASKAEKQFALTNEMDGKYIPASIVYNNHQLVFNLLVKAGESTPTQPSEDEISVTISVLGDDIHGSGTNVHTLKQGNLTTWIPAITIKLKADSTVMDALAKVLNQNGYSWMNADKPNDTKGNYIQSITTPQGVVLGEFTNGKNSGWMYTLNGTHPLLGVSEQKLSEGAVIVFHYTDDYTKEQGSELWAPPAEENKNVTTSGASGSAATTAPTEVTVSGSTATATVKSENAAEAVKQAKENKSAEIVLNVAASDTKGAETVKIQLDTATVKSVVSDTSASLTVKTENGQVSLDREALTTVASEAKGATITLEVVTVSKPTETQQKAAGTNGQVLQLTVKSGDKTISDFNKGKATVTVEIPTKLQDKKLAAIYIAEDGKIEQMAGKTVKINGKDYYTFETPHFSTFALVDAEELGLEVNDEDANIERIKDLVSDMSLKASSSKTSKKNIKVTLTVDDSTAAAIKEIKEMGYTVKYKYYRSTKKASKYQAKITKTTKSYTNTAGKKGTKYYYKARIQVYDKDGKLVAQTALKQCKYAVRTWTK